MSEHRGDEAAAARLEDAAPQAEEDEDASPLDVSGQPWRGGPVPLESEEPDCPGAGDAEVVPVAAGKEPWQIRDLNDLEWALKNRAEAEKEAAENLARAEVEVADLVKEIDRLRNRAANINQPLKKRVAFFESHIRVYAEQNRAEILGTGRRKSRKFLHGELAWSKAREGYRLEKSSDAKARLLEWALKAEESGSAGEAIWPLTVTQTTRAVQLEWVKSYLDAMTQKHGERKTAPGLEFVPAGEVLEVKTGE